MALKPTCVTASSQIGDRLARPEAALLQRCKTLAVSAGIESDQFHDLAGVDVIVVQKHQQLRQNPRGGRQRFDFVDVVIQRLHNL